MRRVIGLSLFMLGFGAIAWSDEPSIARKKTPRTVHYTSTARTAPLASSNDSNEDPPDDSTESSEQAIQVNANARVRSSSSSSNPDRSRSTFTSSSQKARAAKTAVRRSPPPERPGSRVAIASFQDEEMPAPKLTSKPTLTPTPMAASSGLIPSMQLESSFDSDFGGSQACSGSSPCAGCGRCRRPTMDQGPTLLPDQGRYNFSYYYRPYQYTDISKQQSSSFIENPRNPYDNRFFQKIYGE